MENHAGISSTTVVVVANIKPATLMGVESQGMVLTAGDSEVISLVSLIEDATPGTTVKEMYWGVRNS